MTELHWMPAWTWVEIVASAPPPEDAQRIYSRLSENGIGLVLAFLAGPGNVRPAEPPGGHSKLTEISISGELVRYRETPLTDHDIETISHEATSFARECGLPPPPHAFWEIALATERRRDLEADVNAAVELHHRRGQQEPLNSAQLLAIRRILDTTFGR